MKHGVFIITSHYFLTLDDGQSRPWHIYESCFKHLGSPYVIMQQTLNLSRTNSI